MSMVQLARKTSKVVVSIANGANLSDAFDMRLYTMGVVHMPAAWTAASIGFKVSDAKAGTYQPLYDDNGTLVQIDSPAASKNYTLPTPVANCAWVKLWSQDGSGTNTNQGAARSLTISLKG